MRLCYPAGHVSEAAPCNRRSREFGGCAGGIIARSGIRDRANHLTRFGSIYAPHQKAGPRGGGVRSRGSTSADSVRRRLVLRARWSHRQSSGISGRVGELAGQSGAAFQRRFGQRRTCGERLGRATLNRLFRNCRLEHHSRRDCCVELGRCHRVLSALRRRRDLHQHSRAILYWASSLD